MIRRPTTGLRRIGTLLSAAYLLAAVSQRSLAADADGGDAPAQASTKVTLRGHVFLPDGKPAAQAGLYWVQFKAPPPRKPEDVVFEKRAVTDDEGRFELSLADNDAPLDKQQRPLLAYKPGYGLDWVAVVEGQVPPELALRLVEDRPIRGRVTDTEGRRVDGAKVAVTIISASPDGSLDDFLATWTKQWRNARTKLGKELYASRLLPFLTTATDREGRFELSGIGDERVASLTISATGLVSEELQVVNREGFDTEKYNQAARAGMLPGMRMAGVLPRLMGPVFDHVAETELVVRGKVFTGPDRKPVARAGVSSSGAGMRIGGASSAISTQTDEAGRFELRGLRRGQNSRLSVRGPQASNLLFNSLPLDLAPGQTVIDVDVEMQEGIVVEGRVFDKVTGQGVRSGIQFVPLPANPYVDQPGFYSPNVLLGGNRTDDEGRFRILVMPGPGVLMAQAQNGGPPFGVNEPSPYRQATFSEEDGKLVTVTADGDNRYFAVAGNAGNRTRPLTNQNAAKVVDLALQSGPVTCDLPLDPGKTATIAIEDERGQPVTDAIVGGVADTWPSAVKIAKPTCTIYGLGADRPRHVCVLQTDGHLAGSLTLTGDEPEKVTVRLVATASIAGRALDADGQPLGDAVLQMVYLRGSAGGAVELANRDKEPLKTDGEGRFLVENVLPGERLGISFRQGDKFFGAPRITDDQRQLAAGEKLELGDFKVKQ